MKLKFFKSVTAILLVVITLAVFSACSPKQAPDDTTEAALGEVTMIPYDIAKYTVIRPERTVEEIVYSSVNLRKELNDLLGDSLVKITDDWIKGGVVTDEITAALETQHAPNLSKLSRELTLPRLLLNQSEIRLLLMQRKHQWLQRE